MNPLAQIPATELEWLATAASVDKSRPALYGIYSLVVSGQAWALATDSYRMHIIQIGEPWAGQVMPEGDHNPDVRADTALQLAETFIRAERPVNKHQVRVPLKWLAKVRCNPERLTLHSSTPDGVFRADGTPHDPIDLYQRDTVLVQANDGGWTAAIDKPHGLTRPSKFHTTPTHKPGNRGYAGTRFNADFLGDTDAPAIWPASVKHGVWVFGYDNRAGGIMPVNNDRSWWA